MTDSVLTLVFPEKQADFQTIMDDVHKCDEWVILSPDRCAQIEVSVPLTASGLSAIRDRYQCDVFCQPKAGFGVKKLLLADMDSTIVTTETLDDISFKVGLQDQVSDITAASMRGELDFTQSVDARVALIAGVHRDVLERVADDMTVSDGAKTLIATMAALGAKTVLVSGGFTFFTEIIARLCGFDAHHGNVLEFDGDVLTGKVSRPMLDKPAKARIMREYCTKLGLQVRDATTIGDGANDRAMIEAAGFGVGYRPKPKLAACTDHQIWHNDLTALLFAQGIKESEFVDG